jgi:hypothetical protein
LRVAANDFDSRISAGRAAFLKASPYTRFAYASPGIPEAQDHQQMAREAFVLPDPNT